MARALLLLIWLLIGSNIYGQSDTCQSRPEAAREEARCFRSAKPTNACFVAATTERKVPSTEGGVCSRNELLWGTAAGCNRPRTTTRSRSASRPDRICRSDRNSSERARSNYPATPAQPERRDLTHILRTVFAGGKA